MAPAEWVGGSVSTRAIGMRGRGDGVDAPAVEADGFGQTATKVAAGVGMALRPACEQALSIWAAYPKQMGGDRKGRAGALRVRRKT